MDADGVGCRLARSSEVVHVIIPNFNDFAYIYCFVSPHKQATVENLGSVLYRTDAMGNREAVRFDSNVLARVYRLAERELEHGDTGQKNRLIETLAAVTIGYGHVSYIERVYAADMMRRLGGMPYLELLKRRPEMLLQGRHEDIFSTVFVGQPTENVARGEGVHTRTRSDGERKKAASQALQEALERAGVYNQIFDIVENTNLTTEEVIERLEALPERKNEHRAVIEQVIYEIEMGAVPRRREQ